MDDTACGVPGEALEQLAGRLRQLRIERRLTMVALERRTGLGHTTVSHALNGRASPTEATVTALARALGADPAELLALQARALQESGNQAETGRSSEFERRYCEYVAGRYGQLTIIGLDLSRPEWCYWPLDAAYLSLEFSGPEYLALWPGQNWLRAPGRSEVRIERAERALADSHRTVVRGVAGSGKTTLLQCWRPSLPASSCRTR